MKRPRLEDRGSGAPVAVSKLRPRIRRFASVQENVAWAGCASHLSLPGALGTICMAYTGSRSGLKNAAYQDNPLPN